MDGRIDVARIEDFERGEMQRMQLHDVVEAKYYIQEKDGRKLFQITTFGRESRDLPGKMSQTIQLDSKAAQKLFDILKIEFGLK